MQEFTAWSPHAPAAVGPGGDEGELGWGHIQILYKAPDRLYKAPKHYTKPPADDTKPQNTIQSPRKAIQSPKKTLQAPKILDKDFTY